MSSRDANGVSVARRSPGASRSVETISVHQRGGAGFKTGTVDAFRRQSCKAACADATGICYAEYRATGFSHSLFPIAAFFLLSTLWGEEARKCCRVLILPKCLKKKKERKEEATWLEFERVLYLPLPPSLAIFFFFWFSGPAQGSRISAAVFSYPVVDFVSYFRVLAVAGALQEDGLDLLGGF